MLLVIQVKINVWSKTFGHSNGSVKSIPFTYTENFPSDSVLVLISDDRISPMFIYIYIYLRSPPTDMLCVSFVLAPYDCFHVPDNNLKFPKNTAVGVFLSQ